jgi:hypothetical protein
MKKRMRFAALLASAVMLCNSGTTAYAVEELYYFGIEGIDTFQPMQVLDDKGTLQYGVLNAFYGDFNEDTPYYLCSYHIDEYVDRAVLDPETGIPIPDPDNPGFVKYEKTHWIEDQMYLVVPRPDVLRFVLRTDIDFTAARLILFNVIITHMRWIFYLLLPPILRSFHSRSSSTSKRKVVTPMHYDHTVSV